ncbi:MAG: FG-GAP repeat protein [Alphaproteobacteria bacterium]|nr:FG-GAP repeat protein [Alphaproteobacteria bacterium]
MVLLSLLLLACGDKAIDEDGDGYDVGVDCDDRDPTVHPGADEVCDGVDQDCDGPADEDAVDAATWYPDRDGDSFGDDSRAVAACTAPAGLIAAGGDCDDGDAAVHPGAGESCGAGDRDCDGLVGADDPDVDPAELVEGWVDADGDGYGDPGALVLACPDDEVDVVDNDQDCDDGEPLAWTGATERCGDGVDNDCDGDSPACLFDGELDADDLTAVIHGSGELGSSLAVARLGDDGDVLIAMGALLDNQGAGAIWLAPAGSGVQPVADVARATLRGAGPGARLGGRLAAGDLTGDGAADLVATSRSGVRIFAGPVADGGSSLALVSGRTPGPPLVGALDDAAGVDLLFSQPGQGDKELAGRGRLFPGPILSDRAIVDGTRTVTGSTDTAALGASGLVVDIDGDGLDDLVQGAPGAGQVVAWLGPLAESPGTGDLVLRGDATALFGTSVAAGDCDGDGHTDLLVGAPGGAAVYRFSDPVGDGTADLELRADLSTALGFSVALPDLDADGRADLAIGAPGDGEEGAVWLLFSPAGASADAVLRAGGARSRLGISLLAADVTGDGVDDLVAGAPDASAWGGEGAVFVLAGGPGAR